MKCPNCGYDTPYQSVNQRIAEWAADKYGFDPKDFIEITFSPLSSPYIIGVEVSLCFWKDGDYTIETLGRYEDNVPEIIEDMYEYKQAKERAWEMRHHG